MTGNSKKLHMIIGIIKASFDGVLKIHEKYIG